MRILAIRGKNLASLAGEFEIDFQAEPLASAGLFAITGPTGAGKSTMLDALCLALYEKTPRLGRAASRNETIPDVGENSVTPSDPRTLLRRGASEGFAEVDFVGNDGVPYRSCWTVRRAYNKSQGKLQNTDVTLTRLTDQQVLGGHRKTDTLQLIEERIGLSFEQFTRAVLLAQNDFATFLKASDDDRAELLQTLTGTETFSQISMQAYGRMKSEKEKLERLEAQLKDLAPLLPELRAEKDAALKSQEGQVKALEEQKALTEGHLRCYQQLVQLTNNEVGAQKAHQEAIQAKENAAERYRQLKHIDQVQPARPLCAELERVATERETTAKAALGAQSSFKEAEKLAADHQKMVEEAAGVLARAEEAKARVQPQLDIAKAIDAQLAIIKPQCLATANTHEESRQQLDAALKREGETEKALSETQSALATTQRWLEEHATLRSLAENWAGWEALFSQGNGLLTEQKTVCSKQEGQDRQAQEIRTAAEKARAEHARLADRFKTAELTLATRTQACLAFNLEALAQRKQQLEARRDQLLSADQVWKGWHEWQSRKRQFETQQQSLQTAVEKGKQLRGELLGSRPALEKSLEAAEQALRIAELAASETAEDLRGQLQPDTPCPVCGALEHPYVSDAPQVNAILTGLRANVADARKSLAALAEKLGANENELKTSQQQLQKISDELSATDRSLAEEQQKWHTHPLQSELAPLEEQNRTPWLAESLQSVKDALTALTQEESNCREALRQKEMAQQDFNAARVALETCEKGLSELDTQQKTLAEARKASAERLVEIEKQLAVVLMQLDGAFSDATWREYWGTDPQSFVADCRTQVSAWGQRQKQVTELAQQIETLKVTVVALKEASAKAREQEKTLAEQRQTQEAVLKTRQHERAALFGGKAVAEVEAELNQAITGAKASLENAQQAQQKAANERTRLEEASRNAASQLVKLEGALKKADEELHAWLNAFNQKSEGGLLTLDELRTLLGFDTEWITKERTALQALTQAVVSTEAVLKAHQAARVQHESGKPTPATAEELAESQAKLLTSLNSALEILNNLKLEIAQDDARLKQSEALRTTLEKQSATSRVWSQLSDLIGSSDGKKFRNFAQQLTLDILLGYANRHLESLARRYRLVRIADSLGLMVVDQEMGDEVRSVHSLSGGESFLVSLALALGLASLSSHRVRVESLFIDEGFGSLDADSLNIAMEALDNLQALGRKVGVISHVQEMTERIGTRIQVQRQAGGLSKLLIA